jgi:hypothetical protein
MHAGSCKLVSQCIHDLKRYARLTRPHWQLLETIRVSDWFGIAPQRLPEQMRNRLPHGFSARLSSLPDFVQHVVINC